MKCKLYAVAVVYLSWICHANHITGCRDQYVWLAGGDINCKYLYTKSHYGLHNRAEYFCKSYPLTYCCNTCSKLGFGKTPKQEVEQAKGTSTMKSNITQSNQAVTPGTRVPTTTPGPVRTTQQNVSKRPVSGCQDKYVWIADGDVHCKYLFTPSRYGLHNRAEYFCKRYPLTYCCDTCTKLGFGKPPNVQEASKAQGTSTMKSTVTQKSKLVPQGTSAITTTSGAVPTKQTVRKASVSDCRDQYVWIADGDVNCKYLYTPSHYGLHKKAEYFCTRYKLTDCCQTCARLGFAKPTTEEVVQSQGTSTVKSEKTQSNQVVTPGTSATTTASGSLRTTHYVPKKPSTFGLFEVIVQALEKPNSL